MALGSIQFSFKVLGTGRCIALSTITFSPLHCMVKSKRVPGPRHWKSYTLLHQRREKEGKHVRHRLHCFFSPLHKERWNDIKKKKRDPSANTSHNTGSASFNAPSIAASGWLSERELFGYSERGGAPPGTTRPLDHRREWQEWQLHSSIINDPINPARCQ